MKHRKIGTGFLNPLGSFVIGIDHTIYCITDCKIELPLHKKYYKLMRSIYSKYLDKNAT